MLQSQQLSLRCKELCYELPSTEPDAAPLRMLCGLDATFEAGQRTCIVGVNGAGKTTLARLVAGELVASSGAVYVEGCAAGKSADSDVSGQVDAARIGMVHQDPSSQLLASRVFEDVALGPQNLGLSAIDVVARVNAALETCGISDLAAHATSTISGGQQTLVALAGQLAMEPAFLVLDEVCAQLDSSSRQQVRTLVDALVAKGLGVIEVSHHLSDLFSADKVVLLDAGSKAWQGTPTELLANADLLARAGLASEGLAGAAALALHRGLTASQLADVKALSSALQGICAETPDAVPPQSNKFTHAVSLGDTEFARDIPTIDEHSWPNAQFKIQTNLDSLLEHRLCSAEQAAPTSKQFVSTFKQLVSATGQVVPATGQCRPAAERDVQEDVLIAREVSVHYEPSVFGLISGAAEKNDVLRDLSLALSGGSLTVIAGRSGAGKTTLARVLSGTQPVSRGKVELAGQDILPGMVGFALQSPAEQLFADSVMEDVAFGPTNQGADSKRAQARARGALQMLGVPAELWNKHPQELSGGQQRLCALAGIAAMQSSAYVFDEPTAALDPAAREKFHRFAAQLVQGGAAVCVITHDVSEWLGQANQLVLMQDGRVSWAGAPEDLVKQPARADDALAVFAQAGLEAPQWLTLALALHTKALTSGSQYKTAEKNKSLSASNWTPQAGFPAGAKVALWLLLLVAVFMARPAGLVVAAVGVVALLAYVRVPASVALRALKPMVLIFLLSLLCNAVVLDGSADLVRIGPVGVSAAGALRSAVALARVTLMYEASLALVATTDVADLATALVAPVRPLAKLVHRVAWADALDMLINLAVRFVPLSVEEFERIRAAQLARGANLLVRPESEAGSAALSVSAEPTEPEGSLGPAPPAGEQRRQIRICGRPAKRGVLGALKSYQSVLVPVLFALVKRSDAVGCALVGRAFGMAERTKLARRWTWRDASFFAIALAICVLIAYLEF